MGKYRFVAFDIEISDALPEEGDWTDGPAPGISCAATCDNEGEIQLWKPVRVGRRYSDRWRTPDADGFLECLLTWDSAGFSIVSWNGLGFDLQVLRHHVSPDMVEELCELALRHQDMAFQMLCEKGFMIGLDAAAKGHGLPGKPEGMDGAQAPALWMGSYAAQATVLNYVARDAWLTAQVYAQILASGEQPWTSKSGRPQVWAPTIRDDGDRLLTAQESLSLPEVDTSWMSDPWPRAKFSGWAQRED